MTQEKGFSITETEDYEGPSFDWALFPFEQIIEDTLGKEYLISLVIVSEDVSKTLNTKYRKKNYPTNVLAFPLSETEGEVVINPKKADEEKDDFGKTLEEHVLYLFIHALLHLKGLSHGDTMEEMEKELIKKFPLKK